HTRWLRDWSSDVCSSDLMWYRKAAEKGNPQAQLNLGIHCEQGQGVEQEDAVALGWYSKAAEQGYAAAEVALGNMYHRGRGVAQEDRKSACRERVQIGDGG